MVNKVTVYPSYGHERPVVSDKSAAAAYGFPELSESSDFGRHYPSDPPVGFAEGIVTFLRNAMHRK